MSGAMLGLNPEDAREFAKMLDDAAARLRHTGSALTLAVSRTGWQGPDSEGFRGRWPGQRAILAGTATGLEDAARVVLLNIAEQERASAAHGGGGFWDNLMDSADDLWSGAVSGAEELVDGAAGLVDDAGKWARDQLHVGPVLDELANFAKQATALDSLWDNLLAGKAPSVSALGAAAILVGGTGLSAGISLLSGGRVNLDLFKDGKATAGDPRKVSAVIGGDGQPRLTLPGSVSDIFQSVSDSYAMAGKPGVPDGDIRILKVQQANGSFSYIVNIPGTENWGATGGGQGRDLTGNLMLMSGQSTTAMEQVRLAMLKAGIGPGDPVLLAGHSQGGIIAGALASDPGFMRQFNVTNVITAGSPIDGMNLDPRVSVLAVQHQGDIVPKLDLGGLTANGGVPHSGANVHVVTMDNPPRNAASAVQAAAVGAVVGTLAPGLTGGSVAGAQEGAAVNDIVTNHDYNLYRRDMASTGKYPDIGVYENEPSMRNFLNSDPSKVTAVDIPVSRK